MDQETGVTIVDPSPMPALAGSLEEVERALEQMKAFIASQLKEGEDYGSVPGVNKKFMWLSGAEKTLAAFGWASRIVIEERREADANMIGCPSVDECRLQRLYVRCRCDIVHKQTGGVVMSKFGSCDSGEYQFRKQLGQCRTRREKQLDENGKPIWDHSNCRNKDHKLNGRTTCRPKVTVVEDTDNPICIHDLAHNIEQRAGKRAFVSAVVYAARLGCEFTYDEDLVQGVRQAEELEAYEKHQAEKKEGSQQEPMDPTPDGPGPSNDSGAKSKGTTSTSDGKDPRRVAAARKAAATRKRNQEAKRKKDYDKREADRNQNPDPSTDIAAHLDEQVDGPPESTEGLPAIALHPESGNILYSQNGLSYRDWNAKSELQRKKDGDCTMSQLNLLGAIIKRESINKQELAATINEEYPEVVRSWQLTKQNLGRILDDLSG